jgi:hypothetical protein
MFVAVPGISAKPDCRIHTVTKLPYDFVPRVEVLSDTNGIILIMIIVWEIFLLQQLAGFCTTSVETRQSTPKRLS